jgi:L-ribulose-5-phosphate 3-epimerase
MEAFPYSSFYVFTQLISMLAPGWYGRKVHPERINSVIENFEQNVTPVSAERRQFLAAAMGMAGAAAQASARVRSPFRLAVITDEIMDDFENACRIAANEFHLSWVEVRTVWGKNAVDLKDTELTEAAAILDKYQLRVTDFASPLFKVDFKGAPMSKYGPQRDSFGGAKAFDEQPHVLERCIAAAKALRTDKIRCFDFWRLEDPVPYREAINQRLRDASDRVAREGLTLVMENEPACNTGTGAEAGKVLAAVTNANFKLNWDPANAGMIGIARPYPDDFAHIPLARIAHCHCKDVGPKPGGGFEWLPVGKGIMDWVGQFKAFKAGGYTGGVSMETHWRGGTTGETKLTPEAATRISIQGMFAALQTAGALQA